MLTYFSNLSISLWATSICFWTRASSLLCSASICFWLWTFSWSSVKKKKFFIDQTDTRFLRHILHVFVWLGGGSREVSTNLSISRSPPLSWIRVVWAVASLALPLRQRSARMPALLSSPSLPPWPWYGKLCRTPPSPLASPLLCCF